MSSLALTFNEVNFSPVQHNNQIWLTASELAKALGYAKSDAVTQIYERNKDEFNASMTLTLNMSANGNIETLNMSVSKKDRNLMRNIRIFSLRGCHLITFFARTSVAKQFRKWVLDVLDKEIGAPVAKTHKSEREPLTNAVNLLVAKTKHLNYSDAYKLVHQRFNVQHIDEIPYDVIPVAVEYVHHLIALYSRSESKVYTVADSFKNNAEAVAIHMAWVSAWWHCYAEAFRLINPSMAGHINDHFTDGALASSLVLGATGKELKFRIREELPFDMGMYDRVDFFRYRQKR
ncbi:Bro-N domain-containing protein [Acinetobacter baumannii]|uniref:BRO-N domain-containing protein n=1 Tax=Acinetobacter baumannii TaxID=470 RepID=UPI003892BED6